LCAFLAGSTSRTAINNHFALQNNITDLTNKLFAQNNFAFIIGNVIGVIISINFSLTFNFAFGSIIFFSTLHLITAHLSVKSITLHGLNLQRAYYLGVEYLNSKTILDPIVVRNKETLIFRKLNFLHFCNFPLEKIIYTEKNVQYIDSLINLFEEFKFLIYVKYSYSYTMKRWKYKIYSFLRLDAENSDIFISFIYSISLYNKLNEHTNINTDNILNIISENLKTLRTINKTELIKEIKEKGWETDFKLLENKYMRYHVLYK
jgi:hypothetical protein